MRVAKHVQIARREGAEAGLEAFLAAPVSKLHDSYAEITSKRKPETQLKAYCNLFGVTIEPQTPRRTRTTRNTSSTTAPAATPTPQDTTNLFEQFTAFLLAQGGITPSDAPVTDDDDELGVDVEFITHDEAWEALGSDAAFRAAKQERRDGPATNGQLFRLNELGLLALIDDEDEA